MKYYLKWLYIVYSLGIVKEILIALVYQEKLKHRLILKLPINTEETGIVDLSASCLFCKDNCFVPQWSLFICIQVACFVSRAQSHRNCLGNDSKGYGHWQSLLFYSWENRLSGMRGREFINLISDRACHLGFEDKQWNHKVLTSC